MSSRKPWRAPDCPGCDADHIYVEKGGQHVGMWRCFKCDDEFSTPTYFDGQPVTEPPACPGCQKNSHIVLSTIDGATWECYRCERAFDTAGEASESTGGVSA